MATGCRITRTRVRPSQRASIAIPRAQVAPSRIATFAFGPLDQIKGMPKQEDGKVVCRIEDVKLSGNNWKVKVSMSYPPGNAELDDTHSAYQIAATNELVLESKDGKRRFVALPSYVPAATPTSVVVEYNLTKDNRPTGEAKDWTVSFRAPAAVVQVPVAFTFKDVPLP